VYLLPPEVESSLSHYAVQVFYAACQGLLYVLCYRLDHLMGQLSPQQQPAPHSSPPGGAESATDAESAATWHAAALRQLFAETMPQLLHHRCALLLLAWLLLQQPLCLEVPM
jgi:hypothetical protein